MKKALSLLIVLLSNAALAETVATTVQATGPSDKVYYGIAAAVAIALAALGGALGQGKVASAAMEGIARQPEAAGKVQTAMIIAAALILIFLWIIDFDLSIFTQ